MTTPTEELFPFQKEGSAWLATKRLALLADEMGLGKSAQAITAADDIAAKNVLVLCPAVARINWDCEFRKFSPYSRKFHIALDGKVRPPRGSLICSYDLAVRFNEKGWLDGSYFHVGVLDEGHFLKSMDAKRTKAVMGKDGVIRHCERVWMLSGTPMPNGNPGELWVMLYTFGRTKLPYMQFLTRFCAFAPNRGPYSGMMQIVGTRKDRLEELKDLLRPIVLRRMKKDVLDLPEMLFGDVAVLPGAVPSHLIMDCDPALINEESEIVAKNMLRLEALAGSVSTLRRYVALQKIQPVADLLSGELDQKLYSKIVVFATHVDVVKELARRLERFNPVTITGETPPKERHARQERFQTDSGCHLLIGNIQAAGIAITLTAASQVLFVEQSWVPAENAQAAMRCHRIGQRFPVTVRCVALADSIDEKVTATLRRKSKDIAAVFMDLSQSVKNT